MQQLRSGFVKTGQLHHAYILEGVIEDVFSDVCLFCDEELGHPTKANPDFTHQQYDIFTIEGARKLRERQLNKTHAHSRKIFVISFNFITLQAQNALLKVLEEPTEGTHIFIITPAVHVFLPTVLSRVQIIRSSSAHDEDGAVKKFLTSNPKQRMDYIATLVKNIKDEKMSKASAIALVRGLIIALHKDARTAEDFLKLKELERTAAYLEDSGASVKMLLEHVALVV